MGGVCWGWGALAGAAGPRDSPSLWRHLCLVVAEPVEQRGQWAEGSGHVPARVLVGLSPPGTRCPFGGSSEAEVTAHLHTALAAAG